MHEWSKSTVPHWQGWWKAQLKWKKSIDNVELSLIKKSGNILATEFSHKRIPKYLRMEWAKRKNNSIAKKWHKKCYIRYENNNKTFICLS